MVYFNFGLHSGRVESRNGREVLDVAEHLADVMLESRNLIFSPYFLLFQESLLLFLVIFLLDSDVVLFGERVVL